MFRPKHYIILVVLVGSLLLLYGMAFLSMTVAPSIGSGQTSQVLITVTETIITVGLVVAVAFGSIFYFMKSRFEDHSHKH